MDNEERDQVYNVSDRLPRLELLTVSLLKELKNSQSSNPQNMIQNEKIIAIHSELGEILQQNDYLSMDNQNLQSSFDELQNSTQNKIYNFSDSITQKYFEYSGNCQSKLSGLKERIEKIERKFQIIKDEKITLNKQNDLTKEIERLKEENNMLQSLSSKIPEFRKLIDQKDKDNIELQNLIINYKKTLDQVQQEKSDIEIDYNNILQEKNDIESDYNNVKQELSNCNIKLEQMRSSVSQLQNENSFLKQNSNKISLEFKELNSNSDELKSQLNKYKIEIESLKLSESDAKKQLEKERELYISQQISGENQTKVLKSFEESNDKLKEELNQKVEQINLLIQQKNDIENDYKLISDQKTKAELEINQKDNEILNLIQLKEKSEMQNNDYSQKIEELEQKIKKMELDHKEKETLNNQIEEKLNGMTLDSEYKQNEIDNLTSELENLKKTNENLINELQTTRDDLNTKSSKLTENEAEIEQIRKNYDGNLEELEKCRNEISNLNSEKESTFSELQTIKAQYDELTAVKNRLENDVKKANYTLNEKETELKNKEDEINVLRSSGESNKSKLKEQLIESNHEVNRLTSELSKLQNAENELKEAQNLLQQKSNIEKENKELQEQNKTLSDNQEELISIAGQFGLTIYGLRKFISDTNDEKIKLEKAVEEKEKSIEDLTISLKESKEEASVQLADYQNTVENLNKSHLVEIERLTNIYNKDVDQLKQTNKDLQEQNNNYKSQIEKLNSLAENAQKQPENNGEILLLRTQLDEQKADNNNLLQTIQKLKEEKETNNQQSLVEQEKISNIKIDRLKNEIDELKQSHQNQISELEDKMNGLTLKNEEIEFQNKEYETSLNKLTEENSELKSQIDDFQSFLSINGLLNGKIFDLRGSLQESLTQIQEMKKGNQSLNLEIQRLNGVIFDLNSKLEEKKFIVSSLEKKQEEFEKNSNFKVNELKSGISRMFEERKKYDDDYAKIERERDQMIGDIGTFGEIIYNLRKQNDSDVNLISNLRGQIIEYLNIIEKMKSDEEVANENIANLFQQVSNARAEFDGAKETIKNLNSKYNQDIDLLSNRINSLEESNNNLIKEKEKLETLNKDLEFRIQKNSKQNEMMQKELNQKHEVIEGIEQFQTKLNQVLAENDNYQKEISLLKTQNDNLSKRVEKSSSDQKSIEQLEFEKIELSHKISILEGQLQLTAIKMKDSQVAELEARIQELQKSADSEVELRGKVQKLEEENEKLRSERNVLDLKISQLEANTTSIDELHRSIIKCENLEHELKDREAQIERIQNERDSNDLKYEELSKELEQKNQHIEKIENDYKILKQSEEKLVKSLAETELESTNTNTANLQEKIESIRLKKRIVELEAMAESAKGDKEKLEEANKFQRGEIEELSQRIHLLTTSSSNIVNKESNANLRSPYKIISDNSKRITDLEDKIKSLNAQLCNEAAGHLNTKSEMENLRKTMTETEKALRESKTNYNGLVKSLTDIFLCKPSITSIIESAAKCNGQSKFVDSLLVELEKARNEIIAARKEPNYLKQKLREANMLLELEKKKNNLAKSHPIEIEVEQPNLDTNANLPNLTPNVADQYETCMKNFLQILSNSKECAHEIKFIASNILFRAGQTNFFEEDSWKTLAESITTTTYKYFHKTREFAGRMNRMVDERMSIISKQIDCMNTIITNLVMKNNDALFNWPKQSKKKMQLEAVETKASNAPFVSRIPRNQNSSLNDRQIKPPTKGFLADSKTPAKNDTPRNLKKKKGTPFRTPLGELSGSTLNISFNADTPKYSMHRNAMSKIPVRLAPSGTSPPDFRSYH